MSRLALLVLVLCTLTGCTPSVLKRNTVATGSTLTDLQYSIVLSNVAMLSVEPEALPWGLKISAGTIQASDSINPSLGATWSPDSQNVGLGATRQITMSWSVIPVTDNGELNALRGDYAEAMADKSWYQVSSKHPPKGAKYVGQYADRWVWVDSGGMAKLTALTMRVLADTRIKPTERILTPGILTNP